MPRYPPSLAGPIRPASPWSDGADDEVIELEVEGPAFNSWAAGTEAKTPANENKG
jgi:hypothetical protein